MNYDTRLVNLLIYISVLLCFVIPHKILAQYTPNEDSRYDVNYYHIDIDVGIDTTSINGSVLIQFSSMIDSLQDINLDMGPNLILDSLAQNLPYTRSGNHLNISINAPLDNGENASIQIYYHSDDLTASFKGVRYETHSGNTPIIATLSTPYIAHVWYPCKDGTQDKVDSLKMDITIENRSYDDHPLKAVSNGIYLGQTNIDAFHTTYHYKHNYPIVPYYVMFAISNFVDVEADYTSINGDVFPIKLYTFPENINKAEDLVTYLSERLPFLEEKFGAYPFSKEQLGFTELGFYGGIENQTNIVVNRYDTNFYNTIIHELSHMWFACDHTCDTWHEGWLNEGFAVYITALNLEDQIGLSALDNYMLNNEFYQGNTIYQDNIDDPFSVFTAIIYSKGAWTLHMLRAVMGDENFFMALHDYSVETSLKYNFVTVNDLQTICENYYGESLDWFFTEWLNETYYPDLKYNYSINDSKVDISLIQSQVNLGRYTFKMPLEIQINFEDGAQQMDTIWFENYQQDYHIETNSTINNIVLDPQNVLLDKHQLDASIVVNSNEIKAQNIQIYPNPFFNFIDIVNFEAIESIRLISQEGKISPLSINNNRIDLHTFKSGIYYLEIIQNGAKYIYKIVKN